MNVTIYDVAERAGVGIGTVSRVLNDSPHVREPTRQRVLQTITELNYQPNPMARGLSLKRTNTIGIVIPFFTRPFFVEVLRGIDNELLQHGYNLILYDVEQKELKDYYLRELPMRRRVDGLLLISLCLEEVDVRAITRVRLPIVLVDSRHPAFSSVSVDNVGGARTAVAHLIENGHQRIGFISGRLDDPFGFPTSSERFAGYRQVLKEHDLPFHEAYHQIGEFNAQSGYECMKRLLALAQPPTAIFATSDTQALGALRAIQETGGQVPQDFALVGYDDIEVSQYVGLSTIRQPMFRMGQEGARLLLQQLENSQDEPEPTCIRLPVQMVIRETSTQSLN
ncbi:MAG: LacI family transcriptional regulator [Chloroflexi bacterium]|nr:LacI family transcriptional regulator [Chloroflexota bacterium]MBU1749833.1 LacI family transcriptional regulator [Chloroflexota bacterium]